MKKQMPYRIPAREGGGRAEGRSGDPSPNPCSPPPTPLLLTHTDVGAVIGLHGLHEAALGQHRDVAPLQNIEGRDHVPVNVARVTRALHADSQHRRGWGDTGTPSAQPWVGSGGVGGDPKCSAVGWLRSYMGDPKCSPMSRLKGL